MQLLYSIPVVLILTCLPMSATVKIREEQIKGENGMLYDVTDVMDDNTDVVIIKKDGAIVEEQISKRGKNYDVIKTNEACNIQFIEKSPKDCYEATVPDKVPKDIMDECGDNVVLYVKSTNCAKDDYIQKKSCYYRYYYYYKYVCTYYYWGRRYCYLKRYAVRRCYYQG